MAKKTRRKGRATPRSVTGTKRTKKKGRKGTSPASAAKKRAARQSNGVKRAKLHAAAALLKDFHGGKSPIKSGCGRPRGS
jgi:hypothetical protein